METRANFVAIGLFTLILTAVGFGFVYWIARYDDVRPMREVVVRFEGSVAGLYKGGQVLFNGIKVGEVSDLDYDPTNPRFVRAHLRVDSEIPLKKDSNVELTYQGLTGVGNVEIKGGDPALPDLLDSNEVPELIANSSAFEDLMSGARQILSRADTVLSKVEKVVVNNEESISNSIQNVESFTSALSNNSGNIDTFLADASNAAKGLTSLSARLETLSDRAETLLAAIDTESVQKSVANVEQFSTNLASASDKFETVVGDASEAAKGINDFSASLTTSLEKVDTLVESADPEAIRTVVASLSSFASTLDASSQDVTSILEQANEAAKGINDFSNRLTTSLDKVDSLVESADPEAVRTAVASLSSFAKSLDDSSGDIKGILNTANEAAGNINTFSANLSTSLEKVDKLVESADPETVRTAIKSLSTFAQSLDKSSGDIDNILTQANEAAGNINKFSQTMSARTEDFNQIVTDAKDIAGRLSEASKRVDGLLAKVDGVLSDGEGGSGLVEEVTLAARSIRKVSEKFEARANEISNGLARFSGKGLRDVEGMVAEARQTLQKLDRAVGKLESDPSSIIFGGNKVKTYNRRY